MPDKLVKIKLTDLSHLDGIEGAMPNNSLKELMTL